ncbi:MAG: YjfB family protein [Candidatus Muiribacteriota bacterium]
MRIAGEFTNFNTQKVQDEVQLKMLKKSMDLNEKSAHDLLSALVDVTDGIQGDVSHSGSNVDFYA